MGSRPPRSRSIRALLAPLIAVPLVSLLALWAFAASVTLLNALREHDFTSENRLYGGPAQLLGLRLTQERAAVFVSLSGGKQVSFSMLMRQRRATNLAVAGFERGVRHAATTLPPAAEHALTSFRGVLGRLRTIRDKADARQFSALRAFEAYNSIIDAQFTLYTKLVAVDNSTLYQHALASVQAGRAVEMADREVTLVNGALAADGRMTRGERLLFARTVADQRLLIGDALKQLGPALAARYSSVWSSPAYRQFSAMENRIVNSIGSGGRIPVTRARWNPVAISILSGFQNAERIDRTSLASEGTAVGDRLLLRVALAGGLGLIALLLSVLLMVRFGRRITRELTGLQRSALDLSMHRLPKVVELLSRGEDVDTSEQPTRPARITEVAKVVQAFAAVQRTAVEAASDQARFRRGASQIFRNLAWRSQSLLHRQLALLDRMERRTTDPGTLEELFQIDHLTTRMRRHTEELIILSGDAPGRGWREPVPVVDVLRAAIAEVEDYTRVTVISRLGDAMAGAAVADVIHLLAELIENATVNSPAHTEVTVWADRVAHGIVVEVEDRGVGMSDEEMAAANNRLAHPPEFDLADSNELGFFVVARLAARHDIKITLRTSPYGGVAAIVLLPHEITVMPASDEISSASAKPDALASPGREAIGVVAPARLTAGRLGPDDDTSSDDTLGLPKRVRDVGQAATAEAEPAQPPSEPGGNGAGVAERPGCSPDEIGALVVSLHKSRLSGREQAAQPDDS